MNRAYALVWNDKQQAYVPVPETARRRGKSRRTVLAAAMAALFGSGAASAVDPGGLPGGGKVTAGLATIGQSGNTTTIHQGSARAAIDWTSFNIGRDAQVTFVQPSAGAVALNRVIGQDPSQILGTLKANGQVFIMNPNGVLFAPGAQVSAAGILATSGAMSNDNFMAGRYTLTGESRAVVVNQGRLSAAPGGYVALVGAQVINRGTISAPLGEVRLAAANQVSLKIDGAGLTGFTVEQGTLDALAENHGLIQADGGRIYLTAQGRDQLSRAVVNNTGVIEAQTVGEHNGRIVLLGDMRNGQVNLGGTLDASAPQGGDGGFIETSAAHVKLTAPPRVTSLAPRGKTGQWLIDPTDFTVAASGGDITGADLSTILGGSNVLIDSNAGAAGTAGDIHINDPVAWSANSLTLHARRNININANLSGSGTASLALEYGQGAVALGNAARYVLADGVKIDLPAGNNLSAKLGSDGAVTTFYVIDALGADGSVTGTDLQGIRANLSGNYALGADLDASATSGWQSGNGFTFLGTFGNPFTGNFEGLGHTIANLSENWSIGYVGLFGEVAAGGRVGNLNLSNANIHGGLNSVGGLVGNNEGAIEHVTVQGSIDGDGSGTGAVAGTSFGSIDRAHANASVDGNISTGGLIGYNGGPVTASDSSGSVVGVSIVGGLIGTNTVALDGLHSSATVTGSASQVGGLIGNSSGAVSNAYATGNVGGGTADEVGGLIGHASAGVSLSYATGTVDGRYRIGGLIGESEATISDVHADGAVVGAGLAGGLVGDFSGGDTISNSHAIGAVTATEDQVGGLVGAQNGNITNSYATGNVSGANDVGGLVGSWNGGNGSIATSYATGTVGGANRVGGLIGRFDVCFCDVSGSHATGAVTASGNYAGGLIGSADLGSVSNSWASGNVIGDVYVGGLMGYANDVSGSYATGTVHGSDAVGGLVGHEKMGGTISASHSSGNVTGTGNAAGGLVGYNDGTVNGASYTTSLTVGDDAVGGLIGVNSVSGVVTASVTGNGGVAGPVVTGNTSVGGLVGLNSGAISASSATGDVAGAVSYVGGLVGTNQSGATIASSQASGTSVHGISNVGGLVGDNGGSIDGSYFITGVVTGSDSVGGLVGFNGGSIGADEYATRAVTGIGDAVGGLVGRNNGSLAAGVYATNTVLGRDQVGGLVGANNGGHIYGASASVGSVTGRDQVGGLIGALRSGIVTASHASGAVGGRDQVGGFVGSMGNLLSFAPIGIVITASQASGAVSAATKAGGFVGNMVAGTSLSGNAVNGVRTSSTVTVGTGQAGGFAGANSGTISDVSSTNAVSIGGAVQDVGGIVGLNSGLLQNSRALNAVTAAGATNVGGAVGYNAVGGTVTTTYAANAVAGLDNTGGLIGRNAATVSVAYASGSANGRNNVGGLIGVQSAGSATNVYASAAASGTDQVGGLIGYGGGTVDYSYASGAVAAGGANLGGLLGSTNGATVGNSFFDLQTTGRGHANGDFAGVGEVAQGKSTAQMHSAATYAGWNLSDTGSHDKIWRAYDGLASPLLVHWLTQLTITANGPQTSYVYNGAGHSDAETNISYTETLAPGHLQGSAAYASGSNVGVYTLLRGHYSDQQGYDIAYVNNGSLSITPAVLSATVAAATKVYDGDATAQLGQGGVTLSGFVAGEGAVSNALAGTYNSANVSQASSVSYLLPGSALSVTGATLLSNYQLPAQVTGAGSITPRALSATVGAASKVYDGGVVAALAAGQIKLSGFVEGQGAVSKALNGRYNSKNVAQASTVSYTIDAAALTATDATLLSNYTLPIEAVNTGSISRATITAAPGVVSKVYDGGVGIGLLPGDLKLIGFAAGEGAGADPVSGQFNSKNEADANLVTSSLAGLTAAAGTDFGNYLLPTQFSAQGAIVKRALNVTVTGADKVYDGNTSSQASLGSADVVAGEQVVLSGAARFGDKNVGAGKTLSVSGVVASGADIANYSYAEAFDTTANITPRPLTVTLQGKVSKNADNRRGALLGAANYLVGNLVEGETVSVTQTAGLYDTARAGAGKRVSVELDASQYRAGDATTLANYLPVTGAVSGAIGEIIGAPDTNAGSNPAGLSDLGGPIDLPQAFNAVLASLPNMAGTAQQPAAPVATASAGGGAKVALEALANDVGAPAVASAVSTNTRENLLFRRAFSIGDGGIRLPQGVQGSDKDASQ